MTTATRIDLIRDLKELYKPYAKKAAFVEVPEMNFLIVAGNDRPAG